MDLTLHYFPLVSCSIKRSNCYMVWGGESSSPSQGRNNGLEIGCLVDTTNGLLTFTANGKELSTYYQVNMYGLIPGFHFCTSFYFLFCKKIGAFLFFEPALIKPCLHLQTHSVVLHLSLPTNAPGIH